jgi:CheY-like chemotaxis protein
MHGYRAECAYSGEDALAKFEDESFDILVTDYRMEGMNGLELARKVRQQAPQMPVIVVTGYPAEEGSAEVNAWIDKHDMFPSLLDKIRQFIGDSEAQQIDSQQALNPA